MIINIAKIYEKNILSFYDENNREEFEQKYTKKQQQMWQFTLELLKDNFPIEEYDSEKITTYLRKYYEIYICDDHIDFSLKDWFEYLYSVR